MPAIDVLLGRANRQLAEIEQNLSFFSADPVDGSHSAGISASLGTLSSTLKDLEQFVKRETVHKDKYKM
jgi:hypothetical protein